MSAVWPSCSFPRAIFFRTPLVDGDEDDPDEAPLPEARHERRRYPPPDFDFGVVHAFKIAGIILVPMAVVATLFAGYLQGFRADIRLDMTKVVDDAIDRHIKVEMGTFASAGEVAALRQTAKEMRDDVDDLKREHEVLRKELVDQDKLIVRLLQKNGIH